ESDDWDYTLVQAERKTPLRGSPQWLAGLEDLGARNETMKRCFVIMPIGSGDAYEVYLNRYTNIIQAAVEGYEQGGARVFDAVGDLRSVFYKDRGGAEKEAVPEIQRLIRALAEAESPDDSPVFAVLPTPQVPQTRDLLEAQAKASAAAADAAELRVKLGLAEE